MKTYRQHLPLAGAAILCLLAGCGFHLRSWDWDFANQGLSIHVRAGAASTLAAPLRNALRQVGVQQAASAAQANLVIELLNERRSRRVASLTAGARAAEYELANDVQFAIRARQEVLAAPRWVRASRVFRIDRTSLTGSSEEQVLIEQELRNDLLQQIMRSVEAVASAQSDAG